MLDSIRALKEIGAFLERNKYNYSMMNVLNREVGCRFPNLENGETALSVAGIQYMPTGRLSIRVLWNPVRMFCGNRFQPWTSRIKTEVFSFRNTRPAEEYES